MLLSATAGWKIGELNGTVPTESEFQSVLSNLTSLQIRGEYISGADTGDLDNVILNGNTNEIIGTSLDDCLCGSVNDDIIRPLAKLRKTVILSASEESPRYFASLRYNQYDNKVIFSFARGLLKQGVFILGGKKKYNSDLFLIKSKR